MTASDTWTAMGYGSPADTARETDSPSENSAPVLPARSLLEAGTLDIERITSDKALPVYRAQLHGAVGPSETGKTTLVAHTGLDVASAGGHVLICDGEMSARAWRRKLQQLGATDDDLARIFYVEMSGAVANVMSMRATIAALDLRLVIWDSALSLISRTCRSENDNAEVGRLFDRLRSIVADGPAGIIVDHTGHSAATMVSRGASSKFAALDISYGIRLAEGSVPGPLDVWSTIVSVEKDRHGVLATRADREVTYCPLGRGALQLDIAETANATHRLSSTNPVNLTVRRIAELDPPPKSANDAYRRIGGRKATILAAYRAWQDSDSSGQGTGGGSPVPPSLEGNRGNHPGPSSGNQFPAGTDADVLPLRSETEQ